MIYRGSGFLAAPPPFSVSKLPPLFLSLPVCRRSSLLPGEGGEGAGVELNPTTARMPGPL